jgi:hypothetical protein
MRSECRLIIRYLLPILRKLADFLDLDQLKDDLKPI